MTTHVFFLVLWVICVHQLLSIRKGLLHCFPHRQASASCPEWIVWEEHPSALASGLCSSLFSPDETQARFIFLSLIARPLASALRQRYVMCCTVAAGCSGAPSHAVVLALRVGSQPLAPSPPSVFSDAVVWSSSRGFQIWSEEIGIMCVCLAGRRGFALYATEHSPPWLLQTGSKKHRLPFLGKVPRCKWAMAKGVRS